MRNILVLGVVGFAATVLLPISLSFAAPASTNSSAATLDIFARRGAGEPGDDRGNHGAGHPVKSTNDTFTVARRGAGEPGDVRGEGAGHPLKADAPMTVARRGAGEPGDVRGEGAGHPLKADAPFTVARRGADDPKGHIRGEGVGHPVKATTDTFTVA